eukprot:scaffold7518_cov32-Attheya_sp.AAC.5
MEEPTVPPGVQVRCFDYMTINHFKTNYSRTCSISIGSADDGASNQENTGSPFSSVPCGMCTNGQNT